MSRHPRNDPGRAADGRPGIDRRDFLRISVAGAGGLLVTVSLPACSSGTAAGPAAIHRMDAFLEIDSRGAAIVRIPVPEIGQGSRTALAMLVAEELDIPWDRVRVVQAEAAADMGPRPAAAGSQAVRAHWLPFRRTGAVARRALIEAAAREWGTSPDELSTESGAVVAPGTDRRLGYGELAPGAAELAAGRSVDPATVALKTPDRFTLIGTPVPHLDTAAIARGEAGFGLDVRVPGMLRAVIARAPVYGGRVVDWDDGACRDVPGFRSTVRVESTGEPDRPASADGVAVIAESTWAAIRARDALRVSWDEGPNTGEDSEALLARSREALAGRGETFREAGDVDGALAAATRTLRADYSAPFLVHAPMEPMNCVVSVEGARCEIRAPTQVPQSVRRRAAMVTGFEEGDIRVQVERSGGGFGRRLGTDFIAEAVQVAREAGAPVQVVWTREDDMRHGFLRPLNAHRLDAGLDDAGRLVAWRHRQAGTSRYAFREGERPGRSEFRAGTYPAALAEAHRLEYTLTESNLPRGPLRAPGLNSYMWAQECFLDEVAAAAGTDPLEFRLSLLGPDRELARDDEDDPVFSTGRMAEVLRLAAEAAGWGRELPAGHGLGVACGFTFGSYVAHVVEASIDPAEADIRVRRVFSAIDCGRVVNPNGIRHQLEGGATDGLGAALYGHVRVEGGAVRPGNFDAYPLLRMDRAPDVEVRWVESDAAPTGAGEPPYPPILPAVGNAVYAASGVRLRDLPLLSEENRVRLRSGAA